MENNPQLTNFTPTSNIQTYAILTDGSIHGTDQKISASQDATYNGKPITALLYLVDSLSESTNAELRKLVPSLPKDFIGGHFSDNLGQIDNALDDTHVFLAKWSRAAAQPKEVWLREKRLRTFETPFNVDEANPVASRLDHNRYDHITEPYRSYNPIYEFEITVPFPRNTGGGNCRVTAPVVDESSKPKDAEGQQKVPEDEERAIDTPPALRNKVYIQDMVMHAANECISLYHHNVGDRLIAILIFDQPRQYRITEVHYDLMTGGEVESSLGPAKHAFQGDISCLERFISRLRTATITTHKSTLVEAVTDTVMDIVVDDQRKLLASISKALDEIELSMGKDVNSPQSWRDFPPRWRNHLFHQSETIGYFISRTPELSTASPATSRAFTRDRALKRAEKQLEGAIQRLEGTYQVLMSSMSILESERAIEQAEVVTRLTNLAFFFIPLTFVSGLFGMNLVEFDQKLTVVMWVGISLGVTAAAYIIRFRHPLATAAYHTPQTIRRMRWDMLAARTRRWMQVLRSPSFRLIPFLFFSLLGVAVWLAATKPPTDEAKIGTTATLPVATWLLEPGRGVSNKQRRFRWRERALTVLLFAGAGVGLWAVATSTLPVDSRIGLGLVIFRLPVLFTLTSSHSVIPRQIDSVVWCYITPGRRARLPAHPLWFDAARAILCSALGVALWKIFTSPLSDATKIGVTVGAMGVPLMLLGLPFRMLSLVLDSDGMSLMRVISVIMWGGVFGFLPIQAVGIWKVSTASSLSVDAKLGIGVVINIGLSALSFMLQTPRLKSLEYERETQPEDGLAPGMVYAPRSSTVPPP